MICQPNFVFIPQSALWETRLQSPLFLILTFENEVIVLKHHGIARRSERTNEWRVFNTPSFQMVGNCSKSWARFLGQIQKGFHESLAFAFDLVFESDKARVFERDKPRVFERNASPLRVFFSLHPTPSFLFFLIFHFEYKCRVRNLNKECGKAYQTKYLIFKIEVSI